MRKQVLVMIGLAILFAVAAPLWAQTGCTDSPEDPTVLLALVAGAGTFAANLIRSHRRKQ